MSKAEWVAPINRIPISIRKPKGKKLSNVSLLGSGIEIRFRHRDEQDILYLPKLDVHEAIRLVYKSLGLSETVLKY